jgi:hypothetical protein
MPNTAVIDTQLQALAGVVANRYKPRNFRRALNVAPVVPVWAQIGQYIKVDASSEMKMTQNYDNRVPLASHKRSSRTFPLYSFTNGYKIWRDEILQAQQDPSYSLSSVLALANQRKAEATLQKIAMYGGGYADLKGILNLADSTTLNPTNHAGSNDSFVNQAGALLSDATFSYMLQYFDEVFAKYRDTVGEDIVPDRCIVPSIQVKGLRARRESTAGTYESAWDRVQKEHPETLFVISDEANSANGTNTSTLVLYNSDPDVQTMVIPEEFHDLKTVEDELENIVVPQIMKTGGVISNFNQAVLRVDCAIPA